jgi:moderate conductance mechanosensitive channel
MVRLPTMIRALLVLCLLLLPVAARAQAAAAPAAASPAAAPLSAGQAQAVLEVLRDPAKRDQFIGVLESMAKAVPQAHAAPAATPAPPVPEGAAATQAAQPAAAVPQAQAPAAASPAATPAPLAIPLAPDSLGAEVLVGASRHISALTSELVDSARAFTNFPLIARWAAHVVHSPDTRNEVLAAAWKVAVVMAAALAVEWAAIRVLRAPAARLAGRVPTDPPPDPARPPWRGVAISLMRRLPYALGYFALDLVPILLMAAVGNALLATGLGAAETPRLVILAVLNGYVLTRLLLAATRLLVAADERPLRLIRVCDADAHYVLVWARRIAVVAVFGYALAEVGLLFGLYRVAHDAILRLDVLGVHICLVIVVLQRRRTVAEWIHARPGATGPVAVMRNRLAAVWHIIAVFYLLALWLVWAFEVPNGVSRLVWFFVSSVVVLGAARLATMSLGGTLERALRFEPAFAARHPGIEARAKRYHPVLRGCLSGTVAAIAFVVLLQAWGLDSFGWFASDGLGVRLVSALVNIAITLAAAVFAWEFANAMVQRHLARLTREAQASRSARLRTLLPILRTALAVTIALVAGLIVLSEIGVNIAPLLAGAGVIGLAIGFGSQKLVQDIITGLFLLLENTMQVGDVVSLGGLSGSVEALSVRTIRLRAGDGSVHIVPFSAVTTVTNMTRDFAYAVMDISVGLDEDPERVATAVREAARGLRTDPRWAHAVRDDLEVLGIDRFVDLAYILQVRIQTVPGQRWAVARELNQRIKARFDELGIDSPITSNAALGREPAPLLVLKRTVGARP